MTGIYLIANRIDNKLYVGSAKNIRNRWTKHQYELNRNKHCNQKLQRAWNKYGANIFSLGIVEPVPFATRESLTVAEQYWLDELKPFYNICKTAYTRLGVKHTKEAKAKVSAASKARGAGFKMGHSTSEETKRRMSLSLAKLTEEQVRGIYGKVKDGQSQSSVGREYKISQSTVKEIVRGEIWKRLKLTPLPVGPPLCRRRVTC